MDTSAACSLLRQDTAKEEELVNNCWDKTSESDYLQKSRQMNKITLKRAPVKNFREQRGD